MRWLARRTEDISPSASLSAKGGGGHEGGTAQRLPQGAREVDVAGGLRGDGVERAVDAGRLQGVQDHADGVVNVDPGPPGASASDRSAHAEAEGEQEALKGAAVGRHDDAEADDGGADAAVGGGGFPVLAETGQEIVARGGVFGGFAFNLSAVVADGGGGDERGGFFA